MSCFVYVFVKVYGKTQFLSLFLVISTVLYDKNISKLSVSILQ